MDYVAWVENVMTATVRAWRESSASTRFLGVGLSDIADALDLSTDPHSSDFSSSKLAEALRDALRDLERLGLVESESRRYYKLSSEGNKYPAATLSSAWPQIMQIYIDEEQGALRQKMAEIGQEQYDDMACVRDLVGEELFRELDWPWDRDGISKCYLLAQQLSELGMLNQSPRMGGYIEVVPSYVGIVRVTRQVESDLGKLVRDMVAGWETTNVDFKRELNLGRDREKAEFIRDILGLATTKASGRRFLIVGFDDKTRDFHSSVNEGVTQERMEQILHA